jgi:hypothetical protein
VGLTVNVAVVADCAIHERVYNPDDMCRTKAITVGDGAIPKSETMVLKRTASVSLDQSVLAGVTDCRVGTGALDAHRRCGAEHIAVDLALATPAV